MADIFLKFEANNLLKEKFILLLGDSNMSLIYNDLLYLLLNNCVSTPQILRGRSKKRWDSYFGDKVLRLSSFDTAGRDFFKEREYKKDDLHIRYHFITKVSGHEMNYTLSRIDKQEIPYPDIIVVNSCMWDITRWGPLREDEYKSDLINFFARLKKILPEDCLIIWTSTLPISTNFVKGGVLVQQLEFIKYSLRFMILEANKFTQQLCMAFGIDFLDLHYHMRFQLHRRSVDGIHWEPQAVRHIVCILLTHISLAYDIPLPERIPNNKYLQKCREKADEETPDIDLSSLHLERSIIATIEEELKKISRGDKRVFRKSTKIADSGTSNKEKKTTKNADQFEHPTKRVKKKGRRMTPISKKNKKEESSIFDLRVILNNNTSATQKAATDTVVDSPTQFAKQRSISLIQNERLELQKAAPATEITNSVLQGASAPVNTARRGTSLLGKPSFLPNSDRFRLETHVPLSFNFASTSSGVLPWQNRNSEASSSSSSGIRPRMYENLERSRIPPSMNQNWISSSNQNQNFDASLMRQDSHMFNEFWDQNMFSSDFLEFDPNFQIRF